MACPFSMGSHDRKGWFDCMKVKGVKYWKGKAWHEFSKYVRVRDALRTTGGIEKCVCCSCGKIKPAFGVSAVPVVRSNQHSVSAVFKLGI
jgi:hypothetical protein